MKRKIAIFTGNRAEYGLQVPILRAIDNHPNLDYFLIVSGAHLDPNFGETINEIKDDGFDIHASINLKAEGDDLISTANSIGLGIIKITEVINKFKPDIFLVYADRFETFAAAIASSQTNTITAHVEGGDITQGGALDDSVRHAITKLSHIHFSTNEQATKRILAMGEEKWRVHTVGYPGIDLINNNDFSNEKEIEKKLNIDIKKPIIVFTQHSVSNKYNLVEKQLKPAMDAMHKLSTESDVQCLLTYPNNDAGGEKIFEILKNYTLKNNNFNVYKSLGRRNYWGLLNLAKKPNTRVVCVGNSSSGIKETPAFGCPVVNIGTRQLGRLKGNNVIDVNYEELAIYNAIKKGLYDEGFRLSCRNSLNPYGLGDVGKKIVNVLSSIELNDNLLSKKMTILGEEKEGWYR